MAEKEQHALCLLDNLRKMYEEDDCFLSDVTLVVRDGERLKAHKLVLAAQSDFFKGLFRNDKKDEAHIDICSSDTLRVIIKYFYTGQSEITIENVQDILIASNFLQVTELMNKCSDFMARNLDLTNCVTVLRLGDHLNNDGLLQECINYIGDNFQPLVTSNKDLLALPVDLFAKCIKSDRIILFSKYGTVMPAIQREEALVKVIVDYVRSHDAEQRIKDTWPLFRALKLPYIAHHLDFRELGLPELANFDDDPTVHSLIRSSRVQKDDDLRRKYSVDPFSRHNSKLRAYSIKYVIWSERYGNGPNSAYREIRPFSCEGGPDKFITSIDLFFRPWQGKVVLGGLKVVWSNGSTDVAGRTDSGQDTAEAGHQDNIIKHTVSLEEGENIQKLDMKSGWFIDRLKLTTNKGRAFGHFGGDGGETRKTQRMLRRNVEPKFVYLDGIRGYVVQTEGKPAINRLSFKWAFFLDRKISKHSYYNSLVIKEDQERITVAELESEINLTLSDDKLGKRRILPGHDFRLMHMSYDSSDEEDNFQMLGQGMEVEEVMAMGPQMIELGPIESDDELPFLY